LNDKHLARPESRTIKSPYIGRVDLFPPEERAEGEAVRFRCAYMGSDAGCAVRLRPQRQMMNQHLGLGLGLGLGLAEACVAVGAAEAVVLAADGAARPARVEAETLRDGLGDGLELRGGLADGTVVGLSSPACDAGDALAAADTMGSTVVAAPFCGPGPLLTSTTPAPTMATAAAPPRIRLRRRPLRAP
jgi:hypothetical protein